jgi:nicotinate-nucleotide pyrophosphorylase (carboxylating)
MLPGPKTAKLFSLPRKLQKTSAAQDNKYIALLVAAALDEDLGQAGDITSKALIDPHMQAEGVIVARQDGVIAGLKCAKLVFKLLEETSVFEPQIKDGDMVKAGAKLAVIRCSARSLLTGERTALNFIGRLSGIATLTDKFAKEIAHTKARICDTRKTTPGLRLLEKYAVHCGGGTNHRMGLYDAVLIKDNHVALSGGAANAFRKARASVGPAIEIEIEVDTLEQMEEALAAGAKRILLDNMNIETLKAAVEKNKNRAVLEASGGITLSNVKTIAETGVSLISCGALTHSAPCFDVSLEIEISPSSKEE